LLADPAEIAYYACYGPRRSSTADLAWAAGSRWHIEECFQQAKGEAGLDQYQVRTWRAWYAHITLSMLALAWLAGNTDKLPAGVHEVPADIDAEAAGLMLATTGTSIDTLTSAQLSYRESWRIGS